MLSGTFISKEMQSSSQPEQLEFLSAKQKSQNDLTCLAANELFISYGQELYEKSFVFFAH